MNSGHFWTAQSQKELLNNFDKKEATESVHSFCVRWAEAHGLSTEAVRNKLRALRRGEPIKDNVPPEPKEESSYEQGDDYINIVCASKRMRSKEDVLKEFRIDLSAWEVEKFKVKSSEGYRKDRSVEWHVRDGKVNVGDVSDSGKMLVVPLYHIEVRLKRRLAPSPEAIQENFEKLQSTYKVPEYKFSNLNLRDNMLEVSIADLHIGKLAWGKESGEDYDSKIACQRFISAVNDILSRTRNEKFQKIILPIGNDLLNSDTPSGTTTKGTQLTNDSRWQKLYFDVVHILIQGIDLLSSIAPIESFWIPGNHDTMSSFYVASYLSAWYKKSKIVSVDVSPTPRKYIEFGKCLVGFSHGAEDAKRIPQLMQVEAREAWGRTYFHEFHLGDLHHETVVENGGLIIRRLSSLTSNDDWHTDKGYVGAIHKAQAFTWNKERGLLGIINSPVS
jgi:hypothetical protein